MEQQRQRSKDAHETIDLTVQGSLDSLADAINSTDFVGYEQTDAQSQVEAILIAGESVEQANTGSDVQIVLRSNAFLCRVGRADWRSRLSLG